MASRNKFTTRLRLPVPVAQLQLPEHRPGRRGEHRYHVDAAACLGCPRSLHTRRRTGIRLQSRPASFELSELFPGAGRAVQAASGRRFRKVTTAIGQRRSLRLSSDQDAASSIRSLRGRDGAPGILPASAAFRHTESRRADVARCDSSKIRSAGTAPSGHARRRGSDIAECDSPKVESAGTETAQSVCYRENSASIHGTAVELCDPLNRNPSQSRSRSCHLAAEPLDR